MRRPICSKAIVILGATLLLSQGVPSIANAQLFFRGRSSGRYSQPANRSSQPKPHVQPTLAQQPVTVAELDEVLATAIEKQSKQWDTDDSRSPWGVMHNVLAWGVEGEILVDGKARNSITCLCENRTLKTVQMLRVEDGKLVPQEGPGLQGHPGQFLAVLAQNRIANQQPILVGEHSFTVDDLIEYEKQSCKSSVELTFKLLSLCHYCGTEATWKNAAGEDWSIERLLKEELGQPINRVTCGGTHRLMAIGLAVLKRKAEDQPLEGVWKSAATYLEDYHEYAFSLFNPDGSFSTEWFERRAAAQDPQKRIQTGGHVLEWLVVTLPEEALTSSRMQRSMNYLGQLIQLDIGEPWAVGPKAHAIRAMRLYRQRVPVPAEEHLAQRDPEDHPQNVAGDLEVTHTVPAQNSSEVAQKQATTSETEQEEYGIRSVLEVWDEHKHR